MGALTYLCILMYAYMGAYLRMGALSGTESCMCRTHVNEREEDSTAVSTPLWEWLTLTRTTASPTRRLSGPELQSLPS